MLQLEDMSRHGLDIQSHLGFTFRRIEEWGNVGCLNESIESIVVVEREKTMPCQKQA